MGTAGQLIDRPFSQQGGPGTNAHVRLWAAARFILGFGWGLPALFLVAWTRALVSAPRFLRTIGQWPESVESLRGYDALNE